MTVARARPINGNRMVQRACILALAAFMTISLGLEIDHTGPRTFLFFTVLSNTLALAVVTAYAFPNSGALRHLRRVGFATAVAVYMLVVGLGFGIFIRKIASPADVPLHYVLPPAYLVFWLLCVPKGRLRWSDPLLWLIFPLAYAAWALTIGVNFYSSLLRVQTLPVLAVFFVGLGLGFVAVDHLCSRRTTVSTAN